MKRYCKNIFMKILITSIFVALLIDPVLVSAWGDNSGNPDGRPEYTTEQINNGALGDTITFNSISDNPMGHEFNFVDAREDTGVNLGKDNVWNADEIAVEDGKTYIVRLYAHNNSPRGRDAVAENVKVAFNIPGDTANTIRVNGFINSTNASPTEYWDHVDFKADQPFHLEYIAGSAFLENNAIGSGGNGGYQLSDDIIKAASGGTLIGYDKIDGQVPGCYQYDAFIGVRVVVVYDYDFKSEARVRLVGDTKWSDTVKASVGDLIETQISYYNTGNIEQKDIMIRSPLSSNLKYISDSIKLERSEKTDDKVTNLSKITKDYVNIGNYGPNASAHITYTTELVDDDLPDGENSFSNWTQVSVGSKMVQSCTIIEMTWSKKIIKTFILLLLTILFFGNTIRLLLKMWKQKIQNTNQ